MNETVYERAMTKLEMLSVVYNNVRVDQGALTQQGHALAVDLEEEMYRLFRYLQTEAKGQC